MRTEDFKRGVVLVLLVFALVFSIISVAPLAHSGDLIYNPGGTTIEVVQGDTFLIKHTLEWNEDENGAYSVTISWDCYDNEPSENFTFLGASAYFTTGDNAGESILAEVLLGVNPSPDYPSSTRHTLKVECPAVNKDPRNGQFNVDVTLGAYGAGEVPHILGDHVIPLMFNGIIVVEKYPQAWNRDPITIRVTPKLISVSPLYQENENGGTLTYTVTVTNTDDAAHTYTLDNDDNAGWSLSLDNTSLTVPKNENRTTTLSVTIPEDAIGFTEDKITVTATALDNAEIKDNAWCIAHVTVIRAVEVSIEPSENSARPGGNLTFTVTVKNTGNAKDNYGLIANDNAIPSWGPTLDHYNLAVPVGESRTTTLRVTIHENALAYTEDNITVTATSENESVENSASCIARAMPAPGVEVSIEPENKPGPIDRDVTFTVTVKNTGNIEDNYELENRDNASPGWPLALSGENLVDDNRLVNIAPGDNKTVTLTVTIPAGTEIGTVDNITVTATSQENTEVSDNASCTVHATIVISVEVSISPSEKPAPPGEDLYYTVTVTNTGNIIDNYELENRDNASPGWPLALSGENLVDDNRLVNIAPGDNKTVTLTVTIPAGTEIGTVDNITVTATSQADPAENDNASCIAHALAFGVEVSISPPVYQSAHRLQTLTYEVIVKNVGSGNDNYSLEATDDRGWGLTLDNLLFENVAPGDDRTTHLRVKIPLDALPGTEDNITVTATSQADPAENDNASCIAHSAIVDVEVSISPSENTGLPGENVEFTVTVKNTGDAEDNYDLSAEEFLVFYSTSSDGFISYFDAATYAEAHDNAGGKVRDSGVYNHIRIGQENDIDNYDVYRGFVFFDTSLIPDDATITSAVLSLYGYGDLSATDFDIVVQNGQPTYPHDPLESLDYNLSHYSDNGGSFHTSNFITTGYNDITLNENGRGWIRKDNVTKLCLRSSRDINNTTPTQYEWVYVYSSEKGENYKPKLTVTFSSWGPTLENDNLAVPAGDNRTTTLTVTIHENATVHMEVNIIVTATSQADDTVSDNASCIAHAGERKIEVSISPSYQEGLHGWTLTYQVMVKNVGLRNDNYSLEETDNRLWRLGLDNLLFENVAPGDNRKTTLRVTIPVGTENGIEDTITVTATSQADNTISDSASCLAHVVSPGVEVTISPPSQDNVPGGTLRYTVTVKNTGGVLDTYTLENSDNAIPSWTLSLENTTLTVPKNESRTTTLTVTIPGDAENCTWDNITVKATSQADNTISDSASCLGHVYIFRRIEVTIPPNNFANPGEELPCTVTVKNTGNWYTENFLLEVRDNSGWTPRLSENRLVNVSPGGSKSTTLTVSIPSAIFGTDDNVTVTATSEAESTLKDDGSSIARAARAVSFCLRARQEEYGQGFTLFLSKENGTTGTTPNLIVNWLGGSQTFYATHDTYVSSESPDSNYGSDYELRIGNYLMSFTRPYLKFDLSSLPPGKLIDDATLRLYSGDDISGVVDADVYEVENNNWRESTLTWNNRPSYRSENFDVNRISSTLTWYNWNVTAAWPVHLAVSPPYQSALPGATIEYTVNLQNNENFEDNFDLTVTDDAGWGATLADNRFENVPAGENRQTKLTVTIPENAISCTRDNITVTATSRTNENVRDNITCVAHAGFYTAVEVLIQPENQENVRGGMLRYTVTITNTGSLSDNYTLTVGDIRGWPLTLGENAFDNVGTDENQTTTLTVSIPTGTAPGTSDAIWVKAAGTSEGVFDAKWCTANVKAVPGVEVLISPENQTGSPGENLTYTVTVKNTGNVTDTYTLENTDNAGWLLSLDNTSLTVPENENRTTTLTVTIPENAENFTRDNITITVRSQTDNTVEDSASCIAHAVTVSRGVTVSISPSSRSGTPGTTLTYTVTVTNTGTVSDTYSLTASDNADWSPSLSRTSITLGAGASGTATLSVTIPAGTAECTHDRITVRATSQTDNTIENEDSCIAHAIAEVVITPGVEVSISPDEGNAVPGEDIEFTVTVKNTGGTLDTYTLTVGDDAGWGATLADNLLTILAGDNAVAIVTVTVPSDAFEGDLTVITVTATSQADNAVSASDTCKAIAGERAPPPQNLVPIVVGGGAVGGGTAIALLLKKEIIPLPSIRSRFLRLHSPANRLDNLYKAKITLNLGGFR